MTNSFNISDLLDKRKTSENEIAELAKEKNVTYDEAWNMYYNGVWEKACISKVEAKIKEKGDAARKRATAKDVKDA